MNEIAHVKWVTGEFKRIAYYTKWNEAFNIFICTIYIQLLFISLQGLRPHYIAVHSIFRIPFGPFGHHVSATSFLIQNVIISTHNFSFVLIAGSR